MAARNQLRSIERVRESQYNELKARVQERTAELHK